MNVERWLTPECVAAAEGRPPRARSIPMFRSVFVDRWLARAHPALPVLLYGPIVVAAFVHALSLVPLTRALIAAALGWLGFSLFEYVLHRFVFHRAFPDTREGKIEAFLTHGYHHAYPQDPDRLVLPPMESVPIALLIATVEIGALGVGVGLAAFAGTALGYIAYDEVHYLVHHSKPRTRLGRWMRRYHLLHHHPGRARDVARFGVSSPLWDLVFGTYRHKR